MEYVSAGQDEEAARAFGELIGIDPGYVPAYMQAGRFANAVPHLEAASADDANGELHLQLARAYQALQRGDEARAAMAEYQKRHQQEAAEAPTDAKEESLTPPE